MSINRDPKLDYTLKYQIRAARVNFANYAQKKQLVQEGRLLGLRAYPPDNDASIVSLISEGEVNTTPQELAGYLEEIALPLPPSPDVPIPVLLSGQALWATRIGGTSSESETSIATDTYGNVYIAGQYSSSTIINNYSNVSSGTILVSSFGTLLNAGSEDIFLAKYNPNGIVQWTTQIGRNGTDQRASIATDTYGNVYIAGQYASSTIINSYSNVSGGTILVSSFGTLLNADSIDIFLAKYNSNGIAQWATRIGANGDDLIPSIATDTYGNIYVSGMYRTSTIINSYSNVSGGTILVSSFGTLLNAGTGITTDIFMTKYNSNGIAQWTTRIGGTSNDTFASLATDTYGNIYISGQYINSTIFNNYSNVSSGTIIVSSFGTLLNVGSNDIFLAKYNSSGITQWTTRIGGTCNDQAPSIATDAYGSIYITGQYVNSTIFNNYSNVSGGTILVSSFGTLLNTGIGSSVDIFVTKYNSNGSAQWTTRIGGTNNDQDPSISLDTYGNVYVAGQYLSSTIINSYSNVSGGTILVSTFGTLLNAGPSGNDIFLAKYTQ